MDNLTMQEQNQALLHLMLIQEATKRAKDQATEERLKAVTSYDVDGSEIVKIGELLTEKEYEDLIIQIAKEWGVYKNESSTKQ